VSSNNDNNNSRSRGRERRHTRASASELQSRFLGAAASGWNFSRHLLPPSRGGRRTEGQRGRFRAKARRIRGVCGLFGIKPGVPRIPSVIASLGDAHGRNDCIFEPHRGINSKNLPLARASHDMASSSPAVSSVRPRARHVDFPKSFRSFSRESVHALRVLLYSSFARVNARGTLNGIVNFRRAHFRPDDN